MRGVALRRKKRPLHQSQTIKNITTLNETNFDPFRLGKKLRTKFFNQKSHTEAEPSLSDIKRQQ